MIIIELNLHGYKNGAILLFQNEYTRLNSSVQLKQYYPFKSWKTSETFKFVWTAERSVSWIFVPINNMQMRHGFWKVSTRWCQWPKLILNKFSSSDFFMTQTYVLFVKDLNFLLIKCIW